MTAPQNAQNPQAVYTALNAEWQEIDGLVAGLDDARWALPTPAPGWTIAHQVAHLTFVALLAGAAATDEEEFERLAAPARVDFQGAVDASLDAYLPAEPAELLAGWRDEQEAANKALAALPPTAMVPWLVNPLPPFILAAAGMMELFAHGQDIADAIGVERQPTDRLAVLVSFGVRTRDFAYLPRGITPPEEFRFELTGPSGAVWAFGPEEAVQRVTGPAHDFCLLVSRRRHREDLALKATGQDADRWLDIAQAYRGPAGEGRRPGQFAAARR